MNSKKLGAFLRYVAPATAAAEPAEPPAEAISTPRPSTQANTQAQRPGRAVGTVEPEVPLQVLIPANIRRQLAVMAAEEGQSLRALVLRGIRSLGVSVTEDDIKGKRGRRNS